MQWSIFSFLPEMVSQKTTVGLWEERSPVLGQTRAGDWKSLQLFRFVVLTGFQFRRDQEATLWQRGHRRVTGSGCRCRKAWSMISSLITLLQFTWSGCLWGELCRRCFHSQVGSGCTGKRPAERNGRLEDTASTGLLCSEEFCKVFCSPRVTGWWVCTLARRHGSLKHSQVKSPCYPKWLIPEAGTKGCRSDPPQPSSVHTQTW